MKKFSIKEALNKGWDLFKENYLLLIGITAIDLVISGTPNFLEIRHGDSFLSSILLWILGSIIQIGIITITLKLVDKKKTEASDLFLNIRLIWRYLGAMILYMFIVFIGFILLVIPGFIWAIKYQFVPYLIVDKNMDVMSAFKKSAEMTEGIKLHFLVYGLTILGVIILGALAFGIGLFVAIPITWLSYAFIYRNLVKSASKESQLSS